jgi:hypothetical protein
MPAFGFAQAEGWPSGTYDTVPGLQLKLAVLTELPRCHDTLLVRLLGRGAVLNRALHDLLDLPPGSWERDAAIPVFARLRFELPQDPADHTAEEEELAVTSQEIVEALQREATAKGGADFAAHLLERRLGRRLREDERARLRERTETLGPDRLGDLVLDLSADELAVWLADPNAR